MQLKPHQEKAVKECPNKWGLWFRMRVGKTPTSIRLACSRAKHTLVVVPKSLRFQWEREIDGWRIGDCQFTIRTKEDVRLNKKLPKDCDAIIVDEAHMAFGNFKSKTYKALYSFIREYKIEYIWLLTGTPFTSAWSVFSFGNLLGANEKIFNWLRWNRRFFYQIKMGRRMIPKPKPGMEKELQVLLRSIGTVIDLKDVVDVPDDEDVVETFLLNPIQKAMIKKHFDPMPVNRWVRQHQIESGTIKGDVYNYDEHFNCSKDDRLIEIAESTNKLIIVCRYIAQISKYYEILTKKFPDKDIFKVSGQEEKGASEVAVKAEASNNCVVIIQADTVVGYDLKSFNTVIFASMSHSFVNYDQLRYRSKNMEKKIGCTYIHFITEGNSVDKAVYECVQKKQDFSFALFTKKVDL